jgi:hypothetical protein
LEHNPHLVVENLGLASLSLGEESVIEDVEDILADLLQLGLDLLAVVTDNANVLIGALGLLLLLDGGDDAPGGTAGADHVLVGNGQKVTLIDSELAANLNRCQSWINPKEPRSWWGK